MTPGSGISRSKRALSSDSSCSRVRSSAFAGCIITLDASVTLANTPHNLVRFPDTVGIVIESARPEASKG